MMGTKMGRDAFGVSIENRATAILYEEGSSIIGMLRFSLNCNVVLTSPPVLSLFIISKSIQTLSGEVITLYGYNKKGG
jgi:hypothetical protein